MSRLLTRKNQADLKGTAFWRDLVDAPKNFYWPTLKASKEMSQSELCKKLISYLIGNNDFYKVIASSGQVEIQAFNFQGSLTVQKSKIYTHYVQWK